MKSFLLISLLLAASQPVAAAGLPSIEAIKAVTDSAMKKAGAGDLEGALRSFQTCADAIPKAEFEAMVGQAILQKSQIEGRFGKAIGDEFIKQISLGSSMAELIYIQRFEKHPVRWQFYLYRGKDGWIINTFRFDDKWMELLGG